MSAFTAIRSHAVSRPVLKAVRKVLPGMSETERAAIAAGTVWWDGALFTGDPDWQELMSFPPASLRASEQAFLEGPVEQLCRIVDDWTINHERRDLPPEAWELMRRERFFGMIIPKRFGGLGFSAYAHSCVVRKLATRSLTAAVTAMVPNSLGPGELLLLFGTEEQQNHYLPRLASGEEIPCFGLTSIDAGSDAAAMRDEGIVCRGTWRGEETVGMRLNFSKRYITLGPVATLIGLAFKLKDPDNLLGAGEDLGITVALVPADAPGVETGRRHWPAMQGFMNGPVEGKDVFLPLEHIIGGQARAGHGWPMLMTALAAGRSISLPSLSAGVAQFAARTTGAYARIRHQFGIPVGKFEGVQEPMARIAADAYVLDAARRVTCSAIDNGEKPAVIGAIMKYHATERARRAINDAMDVHGGKGICDGPSNYLAQSYYAQPVGITVEGANILTRSLVIFGQGAIRCHPWLLAEMEAAQNPDQKRGLKDFDRAFFGHLGHHLATWWRAWHRNLFAGRTASAVNGEPVRGYCKELSRAAASLALVSEMALIVLGGGLKRKESLSARLGDVLSGLYLASCTIKRWHEEGRRDDDLPLLHYALQQELQTIERRLDEILHNFPGRFWPWILRRVVFPWGRWHRPPADRLVSACARIIMTPGETRERLTAGIYLPEADDKAPLSQLEKAFAAVTTTEGLQLRLAEAGVSDLDEAVRRSIISDGERRRLSEVRDLVRRVLAVDDFAPEDLSSGEQPSSQNSTAERPRAVAQSG